MLFLNWCSGLSKRRGGLACAVSIHVGRLFGLLPGSPLSGGSGSPRLLRRRALPLSTGTFELIRLLLSRARGPASPIPASHVTTSNTRTTGVSIRNTGADPKNAGATAVAPISGALAAAAGVAPSGVGAPAAAERAATTALKGAVFIFPRAGCAFVNEQKFECAFPALRAPRASRKRRASIAQVEHLGSWLYATF